MTVILPNTKPSGQARPYIDFMADRGLKRTRAFAVLRSEYAPPTYLIGRTRFIDEAIGHAWFRALAEGQFTLTPADLIAAARSKIDSAA